MLYISAKRKEPLAQNPIPSDISIGINRQMKTVSDKRKLWKFVTAYIHTKTMTREIL
jgi:hypothetical protein